VQFPEGDPVLARRTTRGTPARASVIDPAFASPEALISGVSASPGLRELLAGWLTPRYPSQIVEALLEGVFLFALLWILRTRVRLADGVLSGMFLIAYALARIAGECFREPDAPLTAGMTMGQFLSLFMIVSGILFLVWQGSGRAIPTPGRPRREPSDRLQDFLDPRNVRRGVDADSPVRGDHDADRDAVLQGPELFEFLTLLKREGTIGRVSSGCRGGSRRGRGEGAGDGAFAIARIAVERDPAAREVEGVALGREDDLHAVGIVGFPRVGERGGGGDHRHRGIATERGGQRSDQLRVDERLVP